MDIEIKHTGVFTKNLAALEDGSRRFIVNQGGTRSSKTYSLCQLMIYYCLRSPGKTVSIVRKSFPALRKSVMKDFIEVLDSLGLYSESCHNKSENAYEFPNKSRVEFFSVDDAQKLRGSKRHILWANEANELSFEEYNQLNFRTSEKLFFDFNPSDDDHWLYDVMEKPDAIKIHSTYKDNSFLEQSLIKEIEDLISIDSDYYNIYALGLPSRSTHVIYSHQKPYIEERAQYDETLLGLDFGFKHATALIRCSFREDEVWAKEVIYETHLTTEELIALMRKRMAEHGLPSTTEIICDPARPEIIEELARNGFRVHNAIKNVKEGIDAVKSSKLFYHNDSHNIAKEFRSYKWKEYGGRLTDEPIKLFDDAMDAIRYAVLYRKKMRRSSGGWDFASF